jgi:PAS domain S-box-containing protein
MISRCIRKLKRRLRTSEEKFSKAFQTIPDLLTIIREDDLVLIDANQKLFEVLGYQRHEVLGSDVRGLIFLFFPSDRETLLQYLF